MGGTIRRIGKKKILCAVLALLPALGWVEAPAQAQPAPLSASRSAGDGRIQIKSRVFQFPIRIDKASQPRTKEVRLYMREGSMGEWLRVDSVPPTAKSIRCQVPHDGEFCFQVQTIDIHGKAYPPSLTTQPPAMIVVVDTMELQNAVIPGAALATLASPVEDTMDIQNAVAAPASPAAAVAVQYASLPDTPPGPPPPVSEAGTLPAAPATPASHAVASGGSLSPAPHNTYCVYGFADYLYLRAEGADIAYAQPRSGVSPLAVPTGEVAVANSEYASAFRVGGGVAFGDGNFVQGAFTSYRTSASDQVNAPAGSVVSSLLTVPNTPNSAFDSQSASLSSTIDFYLIDLDFKHRFWQTDNCALNWIVGARYANLQQQMQADYSIVGATTVNSNIDFNGAGIRLGLEGEYSMKYGVFLFGRGMANLLAGRFNASYVQTNIFVGQQASTGISDTRVVPVLDLEAGAGWQTANQRIRLMAGYYLSCWGNMLTTNGLIQGVQNSNFTTNQNNFRDSLDFDGLMARLELRY